MPRDPMDNTLRELDDDLMKMSIEQLIEEDANENRIFKAEDLEFMNMIQIPPIDTHAQMLSIKLALVEAGIATHEQMDRWFLVYKVTQMRMIRKQILPQIRQAKARAAIMQPGGIPGAPPGGIQIPRAGR